MIMKENATINIRLQPGAKQNEFCGWMDDGKLKMRVRGKPVEGQANEALIAYLSKTLRIPKTGISILSGERNRNKRMEFEGITEKELRVRIQALLDQAP